MVKSKDLLDKIKKEAPAYTAGAFAVEIPSNEYIVGNKNSQFAYTQTEDKDNGLMNKEAENKYLEKIANSWMRRLGHSFKTAEPLTQIGAISSLAGFGLSAARTNTARNTAKTNMERSKMEANSLKALNGIGKALSTSTIAKSPVAVPKQQGMK